MLRCEGLSKSYNGRTIIHRASLDLGPGAYALQGPNGIGKSTLLRLLAGAEPAEAGEIWIGGISLMQAPLMARRHLSYAPDESPIYPFMTGRELLEFVARSKQVPVGPDILALADAFALDAHLDKRFSVMSLSTQKKFMLCAAWLGEPRALLLDEPSNALDISARALLARLIKDWSTRSTLLFTTHDVDFVAATGASIITTNEVLSPRH